MEGMTHDERVDLGKRLARQILQTHGEAVFAIYIYGSTSKNLDRAFSDLELKVIVRDGVEISDRYYAHRGIVVDINYRQESAFLKGARRFADNWPIVADEYRHRLPLFERDGWFHKLDQAVAESDRADATRAIHEAAVALTESFCVLQNAKLAGDERLIVDRCRVIASEAAGLVLLLNRQYIQGTSRFWQQALACPEHPRDFQMLVDASAGFIPADRKQKMEAAERLYSEVMKIVQARGITIQSDELTV